MSILDSFRDRLSRSLARVDGWANLLTGVGAQAGAAGRSRFTFQGNERQALPLLEQLYHEDPFARRIAEAVPSAALRPGFKVRVGEEGGGAETETNINGACDDLMVARRVREAWTWGRVHGGGALVLGLDDGQRPELELNTERLRALRWVVSVTASELIPDEWERDPMSARFGEPLTYRLQRAGGGGGTDNARIHHTRVIRFEGLPTTRTRRNTLQGWGESYLQNVYGLLEEWNGAHTAVTELLQQASVGVYKMRDLMALLASDPQGLLKARLEAMDTARSVARSVLLDADGESYERTEVGALSGLPDLLDRYTLRLTGAADGMPVTVFLGQSAAGLNATGEGDTRNWDDIVDAARRTVLLPALERFVKLLLLSSEGPTGGVEPEGWSIHLPPLRTSTPSEEATLRKSVADTDNVYLQAGVLTPEEVARSRFRPEGWSAETIVDLDAREEPSVTGDPAQADAVAGIVAKVAARELPRDTGVAMIVDLLGADAETAERLMGESGRTFFTKPDPTVVAGVDEANARAAAAEASVRGHQQYTARLIERAKAGGLALGAFTARAPTETAEGDVLEEGDVVAVPPDAQVPKMNAADGPHVAIVLPVPPALGPALGLPGGELVEDLHVTLVYLGPLASLPADATGRIVNALRAWAAWASPILALIGGVGVFPAGPAGAPVYRPVDSEAIAALRPGLLRALRDVGFSPAPGHGFVPHMTVAYLPSGAPTPAPCAPLVVTFDRVALWAGDMRVEMQLGGE